MRYAQEDDDLGDLDIPDEAVAPEDTKPDEVRDSLNRAGLGNVAWYLFAQEWNEQEYRDKCFLVGKHGKNAVVVGGSAWLEGLVKVEVPPGKNGFWTEAILTAALKKVGLIRMAPKWHVIEAPKMNKDVVNRLRGQKGGSRFSDVLITSGLSGSLDYTKPPVVELVFTSARHGALWRNIQDARKHHDPESVTRKKDQYAAFPHLDVHVRVGGKEYKLSERTLNTRGLRHIEAVMDTKGLTPVRSGTAFNLVNLRNYRAWDMVGRLSDALTDEPGALHVQLAAVEEYYLRKEKRIASSQRATYLTRLASRMTTESLARLTGLSLADILGGCHA